MSTDQNGPYFQFTNLNILNCNHKFNCKQSMNWTSKAVLVLETKIVYNSHIQLKTSILVKTWKAVYKHKSSILFKQFNSRENLKSDMFYITKTSAPQFGLLRKPEWLKIAKCLILLAKALFSFYICRAWSESMITASH